MRGGRYACFAVVVTTVALLAGCSPALIAPTAEVTSRVSATPKFCARLVANSLGLDDRALNQSSWRGLQAAKNVDDIDIDSDTVSSAENATPKLVEAVESRCPLIVTVGKELAEATRTQALANPGVHFTIVDHAVDAPNVRSVEFDTSQAAFLAGYLSAYMSKTKIVAIFADTNEPRVTSTMGGFVGGVTKYNEIHRGTVVVRGWDPASRTGVFTGAVNDPVAAKSASKAAAKALLDAGADVLLPIAGQAGVGAAEAVREKHNCLLVWDGSDGYETLAAEFRPILLTSIVKKAEDAIANIATDANAGVFSPLPYRGTLANLGVTIAPPHSLEPDVPPELSAEIEQLRAQLIAGPVVAGPLGAAQ
jgi:basic membrane protein A